MADSDNAVIGYTFFEPTTGVARFVRLVFLPFLTAWDTPPTQDDISGIDKSNNWLPKIPFDLSSPDDMHRGRLIQYVRDTLGRDISVYVNELPENALSDYLYNVVYDRAMTTQSQRLRIGDGLVINAHALAPYYMVMWLLRAFAAELNATALNSLKAQGKTLSDVADHVQFAIDRILAKFNISEPDQGIIIEGYSVSIGSEETSQTKRTTLYVNETLYTKWLESGGSPELFVADWGLNNRIPDAETIANKDSILAAWEAAQTPPLAT